MNENTTPVAVLALNPAVDISYVVNQLKEYQKSRAEQTRYYPGGNGINISRALLELGVNAKCCSVIGGEGGDLLLKLLGDALVDRHTWFRVDGETRINTTIIQQSPPAQFEITSQGPEVPVEMMNEVCDKLVEMADSGIAVLSGLLPSCTPVTMYRDLTHRVQEQGGKAVVDTHDMPLEFVLDAQPWMLRLNRRALETFINRRVDSVQVAAEEARELQKRGLDYVCISLAASGAVLLDDDNCYHIQAPRIHKVSTVGCGDSMVSGLIASWLNGGTTEDMLMLGVRCASATASHPGTELFTSQDLEIELADIEVEKLDT